MNAPAPTVFVLDANGLRFYEETALKYIRDGKRRLLQALGGAAAVIALAALSGGAALWLLVLLLVPLWWGVAGSGQWYDGRQYLVKIEAQRHYRARDMAEVASPAGPPPAELSRPQSRTEAETI